MDENLPLTEHLPSLARGLKIIADERNCQNSWHTKTSGAHIKAGENSYEDAEDLHSAHPECLPGDEDDDDDKGSIPGECDSEGIPNDREEGSDDSWHEHEDERGERDHGMEGNTVSLR